MSRSAAPTGSAHRFVRVLALAVTLAVAFAPVARAQFADPFAWSTDGQVAALATSGSTIWAGGRFDHVGPALGSCVALDAITAAPRAGWPHANAPVYACLADGSGGWYLGGEFTRVNGVPRAHAAHVRADGTLDAWAPDPDGAVDALALAGGVVFLGGGFANVGGAARANLAAVDAASGAVTSWAPGADGAVYALASGAGVVYAGGSFTTAGGQPRMFLAAIDAATGAATTWNPGADNVVFTLASNGSTLYVGGFFTTLGGAWRVGAGAVDAAGAVTAWDPQPDNDVTALAVSGATVYMGGTFAWVGASARAHLAAVDAVTGAATAWNPAPDGAVEALAVSGSSVYAGGAFTHVGAVARPRVAAMDAASGALTAWDPLADGVASAGVFALGAANGTVCAAGLDFVGPGAVARANLAALDAATGAPTSWNPGVAGPAPWVDALALSNGRLYAGGTFTIAGGAARTNLAAIDTTTGLVTSWNPGADNRVLALQPYGDVVYAGGSFTRIGSRVRNFLAAIDTGTALATTWDPEPNAAVEALTLAPGPPAGMLFAGGAFTLVGYSGRAGLASFTASTGALNTWNPAVGGTSPAVHALAVSGSTLLVGGRFASLAGSARANIGGVGAYTGTLLGWNPGADADVRALALAPMSLDLGGDFASAGSAARARIARVASNGGLAFPWDPGADGSVMALAETTPTTWMGGSFASAGNRAHGGLANIRPADTSAPGVSIGAPHGGESVAVGSTLGISWLGTDDFAVESGDVWLSRTGASGPWELLAAGVPATSGLGSYGWTVGGAATGDAWIRVVVRDYQGNTGESVTGAPFAITASGAGVGPGAITRAELASPSPNPCRGSSAVTWALPAAGAARLSVLDVQGREVAVLAEGVQGAGRHVALLPAGRFAPGLYFVRLEAAGIRLQRRAVVVR